MTGGATPPPRERGFTLIEILMAVALTAILAALAYGGLGIVLDSADHTEQSAARFRDVQIAMTLLVRDLRQAVPRPVRDGSGLRQPALSGGGLRHTLLLTRAGWLNPAGQRRSELQRVGWRLDDGILFRDSWFHLDRPDGSEPRTRRMLDGVRRFELAFIDARGRRRERWPPPPTPEQIARGENNHRRLPAAVHILLELDDGTRLERLAGLGLR